MREYKIIRSEKDLPIETGFLYLIIGRIYEYKDGTQISPYSEFPAGAYFHSSAVYKGKGNWLLLENHEMAGFIETETEPGKTLPSACNEALIDKDIDGTISATNVIVYYPLPNTPPELELRNHVQKLSGDWKGN